MPANTRDRRVLAAVNRVLHIPLGRWFWITTSALLLAMFVVIPGVVYAASGYGILPPDWVVLATIPACAALTWLLAECLVSPNEPSRL